jgi:phosphoglycerate dehydrogenase-like enzyme
VPGVITVCVPDELFRTELGDIDPGVRIVVWDGTGEVPPEALASQFLLAGYADRIFDRESIHRLPHLEVIQAVSAGVDHWVDFVPAGLRLANGRGVHGSSTAELAVAGILALVRGLPFYLGEQAARRWTPTEHGEVAGRRLVILGAGDIGRRVAASLEAFGAKSTLVGRTRRPGVEPVGALPAMLASTDILVAALPLTPDTLHLIDRDVLAGLPDGAIVANVARGAIIDTEALVGELVNRRLFAFLDVTEPEPLPADHPLWSAPNVIITPHIGGGTQGWQIRAIALVRAQIGAFAAGRDLRNLI